MPRNKASGKLHSKEPVRQNSAIYEVSTFDYKDASVMKNTWNSCARAPQIEGICGIYFHFLFIAIIIYLTNSNVPFSVDCSQSSHKIQTPKFP